MAINSLLAALRGRNQRTAQPQQGVNPVIQPLATEQRAIAKTAGEASRLERIKAANAGRTAQPVASRVARRTRRGL